MFASRASNHVSHLPFQSDMFKSKNKRAKKKKGEKQNSQSDTSRIIPDTKRQQKVMCTVV